MEKGQLERVYKYISGTFKGVKSLFHYTTTEVLDKILCSASFRASNILYLNDADEYKNGIYIISKYWEGVKSSKTNKPIEKSKSFWTNIDEPDDGEIYTISFCQDGDLLSQWITYARESGVALEIDVDCINVEIEAKAPYEFHFSVRATSANKLEKETTKEYFQNYQSKYVLSNIIYCSKLDEGERACILKKSLNNLIENFNQVEDIESVKRYIYKLKASYIKNSNFNAEDEVRASFINVISTSKDGDNMSLKSKINYFRTDKGVLRPYLDVQMTEVTCNDENYDVHYKACLPLKSITVGPSGVQQAVFDSVIHRLKNGERKIFNYAEKDFQKFSRNFANYLDEVFKFAQENNLIRCKEEITVSQNEVDTTNKEMILNVTDKKGRYYNDFFEFFKELICCINEHIEGKVKINGNEIKRGSVKDYKYVDAMREIRKNFYFTEEGVLIRKSKIPYIF